MPRNFRPAGAVDDVEGEGAGTAAAMDVDAGEAEPVTAAERRRRARAEGKPTRKKRRAKALQGNNSSLLSFGDEDEADVGGRRTAVGTPSRLAGGGGGMRADAAAIEAVDTSMRAQPTVAAAATGGELYTAERMAELQRDSFAKGNAPRTRPAAEDDFIPLDGSKRGSQARRRPGRVQFGLSADGGESRRRRIAAALDDEYADRMDVASEAPAHGDDEALLAGGKDGELPDLSECQTVSGEVMRQAVAAAIGESETRIASMTKRAEDAARILGQSRRALVDMQTRQALVGARVEFMGEMRQYAETLIACLGDKWDVVQEMEDELVKIGRERLAARAAESSLAEDEQAVLDAAGTLFDDADEQYCDVAQIVDRFAGWHRRYREQFEDAFIGDCLATVLVPIVRHALLAAAPSSGPVVKLGELAPVAALLANEFGRTIVADVLRHAVVPWVALFMMPRLAVGDPDATDRAIDFVGDLCRLAPALDDAGAKDLRLGLQDVYRDTDVLRNVPRDHLVATAGLWQRSGLDARIVPGGEWLDIAKQIMLAP